MQQRQGDIDSDARRRAARIASTRRTSADARRSSLLAIALGESEKERLQPYEDDAVICVQLERALRGFGYDICGRATRAEEAIAQIPALQPDLLLVDVNLGRGPSGIDVVDAIRNTCDAPIVFLTAHVDATLVDRALETRSFGYVVKPFELEVLRATIGMALRHDAVERLLREQALELRRSHERYVQARDAAERAEKERAALAWEARHREQLFHELNHRVKNNLQTIMGMIRLECGDLPDPSLQNKLSGILDRIGAIALVHEQLSIAEASNVDAAYFLRRLAGAVLTTHARTGGLDLAFVELAPILLSPEELMTVGMMVSELLVNAVRHAFPGDRSGHITVRVETIAGQGCIVVEDDGIGLPATVDEGSSLGLRLVRSFALRLDAEISFERPSGGGTRVTLLLPRDYCRTLGSGTAQT